MTVQELIERLQKLDRNMEVLVHCNEAWSVNDGIQVKSGTPGELESVFYCAGVMFSEVLEPTTEYVVIKGYSAGD